MPAPDVFDTTPHGSCPSGKIGYTSEQEAERALRYLTIQRIVQRNAGRPRKHEERRVYPCHLCRYNGQPVWHLTHTEATVRT